MNQLTRCYILTGLFLLFQLDSSGTFLLENQKCFLDLQNVIEDLLEAMLKQVQSFYKDLKCIPDNIPVAIIDIFKKTINCVGEIEENVAQEFLANEINKEMIQKCFDFGRNQILELMKNVNPNENYCPTKMTDRNLQINVTTSFTKLFNVNITRGVIVSQEIISTVNNY